MGVLGFQKCSDALGMVEVILKLAAGLGLGTFGGFDVRVIKESRAHRLSQSLVFTQALNENVGCAIDGVLSVFNLLIGVPESESPQQQRLTFGRLLGAVSDVPDPVGQRLKPGFASGLGFGFALLFVGKIEVFQKIGVKGGADLPFELVGQFSLLFNFAKDVLLTLHQLIEALFGVDGGGNFHFIQVPRLFFAVTRNERDGGAFGGQT